MSGAYYTHYVSCCGKVMSDTRFDDQYYDYYWQPITERKIPMPEIRVSYAPEALQRQEINRLHKLIAEEKSKSKRISMKIKLNKLEKEMLIY